MRVQGLLTRVEKLKGRCLDKEALSVARAAYDRDPQNPILNGAVGRCLATMGHYQFALHYLERGVEAQDPREQIENLITYIEAEWVTGRKRRAIERVELLFSAPNVSSRDLARAALAIGVQAKGSPVSKFLRRVLTMDPACALAAAGMAFFSWDRYGSKACLPAFAVAERLALKSRDPEALELVGFLNLVFKRSGKALKAFSLIPPREYEDRRFVELAWFMARERWGTRGDHTRRFGRRVRELERRDPQWVDNFLDELEKNGVVPPQDRPDDEV